jgi:hypothetical protein
MKSCSLLVTVLVLLTSTGVASAQSAPRLQLEAMQAENAQLRDRVDALEKALGEIHGKLAAQPLPPPPAPEPAKPAAPVKPSVKAKYDFDLYGFLKLDIASDSGRTDNGNFARWALSESALPTLPLVTPSDRQFNQTINASRFGLNFKGPQAGNTKVGGQVEFDLFDGGTAENSPRLRTRHAFVQVDWPRDLSLLAGQTWDLIGPQNPNTLDYTVAWQGGNLGFRHPQLRLSKGFDVGEGKLLAQVAATRQVGDPMPSAAGSFETGSDSGRPALQGRLGYTFPTTKGSKGTVGIWGHEGEDQYDVNILGDSVSLDSWSRGLDLNLAFTKRLAVKGELWEGKNLDMHQGGIGQGYLVADATTTRINDAILRPAFRWAESIKTHGGWLELNLGPFDRWRFNLGLSEDNPDDARFPNGARTRNSLRWVNALYDLNEAVQLGIEYMLLETDYKNALDGDVNRFQTSCIYKF